MFGSEVGGSYEHESFDYAGEQRHRSRWGVSLLRSDQPNLSTFSRVPCRLPLSRPTGRLGCEGYCSEATVAPRSLAPLSQTESREGAELA